MGTDEKKRNNANRQKAWYATQIGKGANATEGFKLKIETAKFNCQTRREMRDFCDQGKEMFLAEFDASMCPSAEKSQDKYSIPPSPQASAGEDHNDKALEMSPAQEPQ